MAEFIWINDTGEGSNVYALFRKTFDLAATPVEAFLHLFADTRYRLTVNGAVLAHGPARFFPAQPEYDTHDIAPFLRPGRNVVAVMVNSYGRLSFHSQRGPGCLNAWGEVKCADGAAVALDTGESWRAVESPAHNPLTAKLSFALNQGEWCDLGRLPDGWDTADFDDYAWPEAVPLADAGHWGTLTPRSIPLLDERRVRPRRRIGTCAARYPDNEDRYSFCLVTDPATGRTAGVCAAMTYLYSPKAQQVTLGAFWGSYWLNGRQLGAVKRDDIGLRQDFRAQLREGWNALVVVEGTQCDAWEFYLGIPKGRGIEVSAEKATGSENIFLVGGPWHDLDRKELEQALDGATTPDALPEGLSWRPWARGRGADSPYVERCWKLATGLPGDESLTVKGSRYAPVIGPDSLLLTYDFGGEVIGRPVLDVTAAPGTVIDLTYGEKVEKGRISGHGTHHIRMAERFVTRGGRQRIQTFHPRGMRYLEVIVSGKLSSFELHDIGLTRANYPVRNIGDFECSDPLLNEIWKLGRRTLNACMEDAYLDCPWRERGLYSGDFMVQFHTNLAVYGDFDLYRRCIDLFWQGQGANGLVPAGAHGLAPGRHPDYTATELIALRVYYERTGDLSFPRECLPHVVRALEGFDALREPNGDLLDGSDLHPYLDLSPMDRGGINCALNCFYYAGYASAACVFRALGEDGEAERAEANAERLAEAIRREFWDQERGVFTDRRPGDVPETMPSTPANVLPLLFGIADGDQIPRVLEFVKDRVAHNFLVPEPKSPRDQNVTTYFSFYALGSLLMHGCTQEVLDFVRECWGWMIEKGAWTSWEYFSDNASLCHAWGSAPTYYLSSHVLGVCQPVPGCPNKVRLDPHPGDLQWAAGTWPHPAGPIRVEWRVVGGKLLLEYEAPDDVEIEIGACLCEGGDQ